jgi:hypothetical protein
MATGFAAWTNQFGRGLSLKIEYRQCLTLQPSFLADLVGYGVNSGPFRVSERAIDLFW